jgi:hypothetical protein
MNAEETTVETPKKKAPAKRKQKRSPARTRPAEALAKAEGILAGLTVTACCHGCNVDGCVISGKHYCAHPRKGGLHSNEKMDNGAMRRLQDAEKVLGEQMLDARYPGS